MIHQRRRSTWTKSPNVVRLLLVKPPALSGGPAIGRRFGPSEIPSIHRAVNLLRHINPIPRPLRLLEHGIVDRFQFGGRTRRAEGIAPPLVRRGAHSLGLTVVE